MAKFDAATAVELLEYDFTKYGGSKGEVQEPTTGQVSYFFAEMRKVMQEVRAQGSNKIDEITEEMSEEEIAEKMDAIEEASAGAQHFQQRTIELLAELCGAKWEPADTEEADGPTEPVLVLVGGAPSYDDLTTLPYRVLQAFSKWLVEAIRPKETTQDTRPSPQDRKRRTTSRRATSN